MNPLDRAIEFFAPGVALKRQQSRLALESYRGAYPRRMEKYWPRQFGITGQTYTDRYELRSERDRSRHVDRNNPIGQGILNRVVDNVVGEGYALRAKSSSKEWNAEQQGEFGEWLNDADVRGMVPGQELLRLMYRGHHRDGDVGMVLVSKGGTPKLQLIEGDQIYQPDGEALTPTFVDGVEMDRTGAPVRFHVLDAPQGGTRKFTPIPAKNFIFFPRFTRYGNNVVRGEPAFGTNFTLLDQVDEYVDAVAIAARMAAIFGLIFKELTAPQQLGALPGLMYGNEGGAQKAITIENGQVKYVGGKDSVAQVQAQQPLQQTPEFVALLLRLIGLPFDMPLELVLLDFSRTNFSSARAAFLQFYRAMIPRQQHFRIKTMSRTYDWWTQIRLMYGLNKASPPEDYKKHHFQPRGWQWVDPVRESQGVLMEIAMGANSPQRVCDLLGRDYDDILAEIAADAQARKMFNLPLNVSSMTRDALAAAMQATDTNLDDPNEPGSGQPTDGLPN